MRALLDISVVIADDLEPLPGELAISAVTIAELHFGILVVRAPMIRAERLRRLSLLQGLFSPFPVDGAVAGSYGLLAAAVAAAGRRPRARSLDLLIAATAHAHGVRLYTRNAADLVGVEEHVHVVAV